MVPKISKVFIKCPILNWIVCLDFIPLWSVCLLCKNGPNCEIRWKIWTKHRTNPNLVNFRKKNQSQEFFEMKKYGKKVIGKNVSNRTKSKNMLWNSFSLIRSNCRHFHLARFINRRIWSDDRMTIFYFGLVFRWLCFSKTEFVNK